MAFQGDSIYWVEVEKIVANPFQPRREFDQARLQELADSIRMYGVLQPLTVTRKEVQRDDGTFFTEYELIAGERRLRASKLAGVSQVPVIIREGEQNEQEKLELAIIENLQREDLNAVDRALAFRQLADAFGLSHGQVAEKVGRSREYVSNSIRLLGLPDEVLDSLRHGDLSEGHARTLLMLSDKPEEQQVIYKEILLKKLSVREVERIVRKIAADKVRKKNPAEFDTHLIELEKQFTETLGTRVQIQKTDFGGKLTIDYFSEDDLATILQRVSEERTEQAASVEDAVARLSQHTPLDVSPRPATTEPVPENAAEVQPETPIEPEPPQQPETKSAPAQPQAAPYTEMADTFTPPQPPRPDPVETPPYPRAMPDSVPGPAPADPTPRVSPEPQTEPSEEPAPAPKAVDDADTKSEEAEEPSADESGLYSIRNFSI